MLARHRQSLILQAVRSDGSARVSDLTQRLGVSDMTIRRDLEVLARDGLVEKVHGGAVLPGTPSSHEPGFEAKLVLERPEKTAIARAAASMVTPGTAIALAAGTTTFALAQCLLDVPGLTIVTNSLRVTNVFSGMRGGLDGTADSVVLTGGVRTPSDALVGPIADLTIRSLHQVGPGQPQLVRAAERGRRAHHRRHAARRRAGGGRRAGRRGGLRREHDRQPHAPPGQLGPAAAE
jgi:DeoR/GlpR family transcriptional regulator of sugar metabolism